ncbi:MAG: hypothetical protein WCV67_21020 [Victivallaceae bacterium]|jgi:hypothetical protein
MKKKYSLLVVGLCAVVITGNAVAQVPGGAAGNNIAMGKKYTMSALPTNMWEKSLKAVPDYSKILTDGIIEKGESGSFWVSDKCANFSGAMNTDVIIDLGKECPVSAIKTRHGARPSAGICFPKKEEYFVSDDGVKFYKVGEFKNTFDDYSLKDELEIKKRFAAGVREYGISGLKTRGRYVMVRTYGSGVGKAFPNYVGYDEIFVIDGNFALSEAVRDESAAIGLKALDIPANVLGYRINPPDLQKMAQQQPMYMALAPTQFIGDNEFHLSVGGVHALTFSPLISNGKTITDTRFECELPSSIELLGYHRESKLISTTPVTKNGNPYLKYSFVIPKLTDFAKSYSEQLYLIVSSKSTATGKAGDAYYQYSYNTDGKKYDRSDSFAVIVDQQISAREPKRFITGYWLPYQSRFLSNPEATDKITGFYHALGFNCQNGGNLSPESSRACRRNGITLYGGSGFDNGMMLSGDKIPEEEQFKYHPDKANDRKNVIGVCPTLLYTSPKYADILKQKFIKTLAAGDHIYSNWEPYMFMKQGCICDRCKKEFQKFSKLSDEELAKIWPACVINEENNLHNRFSSYQYASIIKLAQKTTREVNGKANFMIAYEPSFVNTGTPWSKYHAHRDFYKDIDMTIMWSYPNTISLSAIDIKSIPGDNLAQLPEDFADAKRIADEAGRKEGDVTYPRIFFMGTEYMFNNLVMPKDYYFLSLLCFFSGLDGYGTWCTHFKCDARYTAMNAKANTIISDLENIVLDGRKVENVKIKIVSPVPEKISDKPVKLSIVRAFEYQGRELVAVGNDYIYRIYIKLSISGLPAGEYSLTDAIGRTVYRKDRNAGYSAQELADGVLIQINGKEWAALMLNSSLANSADYTLCFQADSEKHLAKDAPVLKSVIADFR